MHACNWPSHWEQKSPVWALWWSWTFSTDAKSSKGQRSFHCCIMTSNTEIRSPTLAALLVLVVLWAGFVRGLTVEDLPQPQQLIQAANEISNISKIRPYILTATVVLHPDTQNQKSGRLTIYR